MENKCFAFFSNDGVLFKVQPSRLTTIGSFFLSLSSSFLFSFVPFVLFGGTLAIFRSWVFLCDSGFLLNIFGGCSKSVSSLSLMESPFGPRYITVSHDSSAAVEVNSDSPILSDWQASVLNNGATGLHRRRCFLFSSHELSPPDELVLEY